MKIKSVADTPFVKWFLKTPFRSYIFPSNVPFLSSSALGAEESTPPFPQISMTRWEAVNVSPEAH